MKQTTLQTLIAWGDKMMKEHPLKHLSFAEAIDKAEELLEMEKEQIEEAWNDGNLLGRNGHIILEYTTGKEYYKETYKQ